MKKPLPNSVLAFLKQQWGPGGFGHKPAGKLADLVNGRFATDYRPRTLWNKLRKHGFNLKAERGPGERATRYTRPDRFKIKSALRLPDEAVARLAQLKSHPEAPRAVRRRGEILLALAQGQPINHIAGVFKVSRHTVYKTLAKFNCSGIEGLLEFSSGRGHWPKGKRRRSRIVNQIREGKTRAHEGW